MKYYLICPVGAVAGKEDLLTYSSDEQLQTGAVVKIPFGRQQKQGIVIKESSRPNFATKPVGQVLEETIPEHLIKLASWISEYYAARLTTVFQTILPRGLGKVRRKKVVQKNKFTRAKTDFKLTLDQAKVIETVEGSTDTTYLLHGITGSGKTRVYQELSKKVVQNNQSVLVLVPEIALTPQLAAEFEQLHKNILVLHSGLTEADRHLHWQLLNDSSESWVVVGPRSILFSPLKNVGLIVVDECHEPSYQQDSQPKYSALRVARKLADLSGNTKLVLGSATPLVADYFIAEATKTPILKLEKPTSQRDTEIKIIDMREREIFGNHPLFSTVLMGAIRDAIANNSQVLLFHNRRGTARMSLCTNCGWIAECPNCHLPMRLHHDHAELRCHTCGHKESLPQLCPVCKSPDIDFKGFGSKRIESEVKKLFPEATVARFDSDTAKKEQLQHRYQDLYDNKIQIIIGTQGLAKGLDLPHLNTVGIVQADSELFIADYSSTERSFQLTTQLIGRAGRTGSKSQVIIQTFNPDHPSIIFASRQDYNSFYNHEVKERKAEHMPPHTYLLQLTTGYSSKSRAEAAASNLSEQIKKRFSGIHVRGPSPAFHDHRGSQYYQQLVVSSASRSELVAIAKSLPARWQFMLDPLNLL